MVSGRGRRTVRDPEATSRVVHESSLRIAGKAVAEGVKQRDHPRAPVGNGGLGVTTSFGLPSRAHWNTENTV